MSDIQHTAISLPFRDALVTARGELSERRGYLLGLEYNGTQFVSEISLLPEFGTEHIEHAERILDGDSLMLSCAPATVFGLDCLRYAAERAGQGKDTALRVPTAMLLGGKSMEEILATAREYVERGFVSLKLKVAHRTLEEDIQLVCDLASELPNIRLRIDANLGWTEDHTVEFARGVPHENIEWLEDPCRMPLTGWKILAARTGLPLACDEGIDARALREYSASLGVHAVVLKPARLGAILGLEPLIERFRSEGIRIVLSSMYDSSIGLTYLAHLAHELGDEIAQGVGTLELLADDTLTTPVHYDCGALCVPALGELAKSLKPEFRKAFGW
ncbi:MAG: o-succinylbenzoate synthase [Calditrichaeota bacterium]|nr:o-succinylbenzoate synthase [Calditrichota bacterium]